MRFAVIGLGTLNDFLSFSRSLCSKQRQEIREEKDEEELRQILIFFLKVFLYYAC